MIPNDAVVHLSLFYNDVELATGTGVLYRRADKTYIVTAWHNVTGRNSETLRPLSKHAALPNLMRAIVACQMILPDGKVHGTARLPFDIPLEDDERTFYYVHPQGWPRVDVVAIPIDTKRSYPTKINLSTGQTAKISQPMVTEAAGPSLGSRIAHIQKFAGASAQFNIDAARYLSVSDDLFILGYPMGITDHTYQPLWKRATVATIPALGWQNQKMFLVDCASRQGMSGAPVVTTIRTAISRLAE